MSFRCPVHPHSLRIMNVLTPNTNSSSGLTESPTSMEPVKHSLPTATASIVPEDIEAQKKADKQQCFQMAMNQKMDLPVGYSKVSVLIIRWDESIDQLPHTQEITKLQTLFREKFNYKVQIAKLNNIRQPQLQLNSAISNHICKYDGPNNLLIIYYTGHGALSGDTDRLEFSAYREFDDSNKGSYPARAFWDEAEAPLCAPSSQSDVLVLLDCCYGSNAIVKSGDKERRIYELIAASGRGELTPGPGKNSFTNALIKSLETLQDQNGNNPFPTTKLVHNIRMIRSKPSAQLWDKLNTHNRHIMLAPLNTKEFLEKEKALRSQGTEKAAVHIRFSLLDNEPDMETIERWAVELHEACQKARMPVRRIDWTKMDGPLSNFRDVVLQVIERRKSHGSLESLRSPTSGSLKRQDPPGNALLSPSSSLSGDSPITKRRRHSSQLQGAPQRRSSGNSHGKGKKAAMLALPKLSLPDRGDTSESFSD